MDAVLPTDVTASLPHGQAGITRRRVPYSVRWAQGELPLVELTPNGFVVAADNPPPMGGYTDIFQGDDRIFHGLVVCTWSRDGLVGYEFKLGGGTFPVRADHAPPHHNGLLKSPD